MTISKRSNLFRVYAWCIHLHTIIKEEPLKRDYLTHGTDLCHFVRTLVITTPAVILMQLTAYGAMIAALFVMPYRFFGWSGISTFGSLIAVTILLMVVIDLYAEYRITREPKAPPTEPTFGAVFKEYIKARKSRICPFITWEDGR